MLASNDFLEDYYCASLLTTRNESLAQSMQEYVNDTFLFGHVKLTIHKFIEWM